MITVLICERFLNGHRKYFAHLFRINSLAGLSNKDVLVVYCGERSHGIISPNRKQQIKTIQFSFIQNLENLIRSKHLNLLDNPNQHR